MKFFKLLLFVTTVLFADYKALTQENNFLPVTEAFKVEATKVGDNIETKIILGDNIHLTAKTLKYVITKPKEVSLDIKKPEATDLDGSMVYEEDIKVTIPLKEIRSKISGDYTLAIKFSGCSENGICYNPQVRTFDFKGEVSREIGFFDKLVNALDESNPNGIVDLLVGESSIFIILLFLVLGLLLALTPCIFPMIPILSTIIVSHSGNGEPSASKGFFISLVYVLSMAVTYTLVGVISGLAGADIQSAFQNPWVLTAFALMFFALAMSLFGYYELQLPSKWQSKINSVSDQAQGKGILGTVIMGFLSAFIIGPCVAPPLAGAVIFISQTGDALLGGMALFAMSMGMGLPLLIVGLGAGKFMPKPGGWMTAVSETFGVVMLGLAIFMLGKVVSPSVTMILWSLLFMGTAFYMGVFNSSSERKGMKKLFQLLAFVFLIYGASIFIGALTGAKSILHPFKSFTSGAKAMTPLEINSKSGYTIASLQKEVESSTLPVVVDFRKKSCASCDELEEVTFPAPSVVKELKRFTFIQVDVTDNSDDDKALMKHFGIFGTPSIIFFDQENNHLPSKNMSGFQTAKKFTKQLKGIN